MRAMRSGIVLLLLLIVKLNWIVGYAATMVIIIIIIMIPTVTLRLA